MPELSAVLILSASLAAPLGPGDAAPDFELQATTGQSIRLSELRGRGVVLAFFPKAFTGG